MPATNWYIVRKTRKYFGYVTYHGPIAGKPGNKRQAHLDAAILFGDVGYTLELIALSNATPAQKEECYGNRYR